MSDDATPRLTLPYLAASQAQKHVTLNEAMSLLDGLIATAALSRVVAAQPSTPVDGDCYILPEGATGSAWAGLPDETVLRFEAGAWTVLPLPVGAICLVLDENAVLLRNTGGWSDLGTLLRHLTGIVELGVGTTPDALNKLAVKSAAVLFDNLGAGVQLKLNKAITADSGSVVFQTGYSGRAEVGLAGDDALHLRTSSDGSSWTDALVAVGGKVGVGVASPTSRLHVGGAVRVASVAKASLPSAAAEGAGAVLFVPDDAGGATLAFSDGAAWRRVSDLAAVA